MANVAHLIEQRDGRGVIPPGNLNKRTLWGSLWLPSQETIKVCHALLQDPKFFRLLHRIDQELAVQARAGGWLFCDGVLHRADYPRKPRACPAPAAVRDEFQTRLGFIATGAASGAPRCRRAFSGGAYTSAWRWCWCLPRMPGRHQRQRGLRRGWGFRSEPWNAGAVVAGRFCPDPAMAGAVRQFHASGREQPTPRCTPRTLCR